MRFISSCILLFLSAFFASAAVVFSDSFTYPDGALTNVAAGNWAEHSSGTPVQVVSGQVQLSSSLSEDVHAALTNQLFATGSGATLYASFTVKFTALPTSGGACFAHFNSSSFRCVVWASTVNAASGFRLGIGNTSSATASSGQMATDLSLNTTYTVVTRYNVGTGSSTLWLNPANETDPSVTATDATGAVFISSFSLRQASGEGALLFDNLIVGTNFAEVISASNAAPTNAPVITAQPQSQAANTGDTVFFNVVVTGTAPFSYQWRSNNIVIPSATNDTFTLVNVTTNLTGSSYFVTVTNVAGVTNSQFAALTVNPPPPTVTTSNGLITLLTYNVNGNGVADWSTNAAQVQAIGRELVYFNADIITFNEIPYTNTWQMANWVTAFMPGFYLATNSGTDSFIRSVIASRFPIARSQSWLNNSSLAPYGYTGTGFTRDLFEAQIAVPNYPLPLHIFVAHLKATGSTSPQDDADKRAAQASAVSNFFANTFLPGTNGTHPYILSGDLNEDAFSPDNNYTSGHPIQRLTSAPTGLQLTTPVNPFWNSPSNSYTESIRGPLDTRFDYILPSTAMFSNIVSSQVFRTDLLTNFPSNLFSNDNKIASDHLPVLMVFANPFDTPFQLLSIERTNQSVTLKWESQKNRSFNIEASSNLATWTPFASDILTTTTNSPFVFTTNNVAGQIKFFRIYRVP
ncbi:MAG: endonuclease/exonuclease/phosphatase family protein [Verrucomicrobiales bacterium]|nr:endonuclease/exonuclease/phosphatase family protein [Verrucomicrobiales bacterium]